MGIVIGIDVGISTTKIVGIKNGKVSAPISITAADPITSLFGAFGKYLHDNDIDLKDVSNRSSTILSLYRWVLVHRLLSATATICATLVV